MVGVLYSADEVGEEREYVARRMELGAVRPAQVLEHQQEPVAKREACRGSTRVEHGVDRYTARGAPGRGSRNGHGECPCFSDDDHLQIWLNRMAIVIRSSPQTLSAARGTKYARRMHTNASSFTRRTLKTSFGI